MASPRILVIQPDELDPPARLGDWLTGAGAELDIVMPPKDELPEPDGYQGIVCLGGAMGANDDLDHPWVADVRRLLAGEVRGWGWASAPAARRAEGTGITLRPVLAVCLGAQLLAVATGGTVVRGEAGPEVGPQLVAKRDLAWRDPLFADLPFMPDVLQFHSDAIVRLPPNAALLASSARYPNQAFRIGPVAYGVQFHIETTPEIVLTWAELSPEAAGTAPPGELEPARLAEFHRDLEETWRPFAERFVRLAGGELQPATPPGPALPLA